MRMTPQSRNDSTDIPQIHLNFSPKHEEVKNKIRNKLILDVEEEKKMMQTKRI